MHISAAEERLGWEEVRSMLKDQKVDPIREQTLAMQIESARRSIPDAVQQAYCIVVTVSDKNDVQAFKTAPNGESLFSRIRQDTPARIQDTAITPEALLPGYELKLSVRVELGGEKVPPDNVVEAVNRLLTKVSDRLKLK